MTEVAASSPIARPKSADGPDLTLVMARIEAAALSGEISDEVRATLARRSLWQNLDPPRKMRWARLAQAAGEMDTALAVLEALCAEHGDLVDAWQDRLELLAVLNRGQDLARVAAAGRARIGEAAYRSWMTRAAGADGAAAPRDEDAAAAPFERLRWREKVVNHFMDLFSGREDCFARQWADRSEMRQGYAPVRRPLSAEDVEEHLNGRKTYGIYLMRADATVTCAVIDADLKTDWRNRKLSADEGMQVRRECNYLVSRLRETGRAAGLVPLVEVSGGKGLHFWFFFSGPVPAEAVRRSLSVLTNALAGDLTCFSLEVFPKQDRLSGKGFGNLVKLPLGVHRLSGKRSVFPECADRTIEAQLRFLSAVAPVDPAVVEKRPAEDAGKLVVHPRLQQWAETYPELFRLHQCCPPLGQLIAACRERSSALSLREEKVCYQTIGFLPRAGRLLHHLLENNPEYNPHQIDYRLSRLRGMPIGCRRIHQLLHFEGEFCRFEGDAAYAHPLLHLPEYDRRLDTRGRPEKIENLADAMENLQASIDLVKRFMR